MALTDQAPSIPASVEAEELTKMLIEINNHEQSAFVVLKAIINHVHGTYNDKYNTHTSKIVNTKSLLLGMNGMWANVHCALKYIQRYMTEGFPKSYNRLDVLKAIHYLIFELQRRLHMETEDLVKGK